MIRWRSTRVLARARSDGRVSHPTGLAYLTSVTRLLQDVRLAEPDGCLWEAADLQWWWRVDQHLDPAGQTFIADAGRPRVAAVFTGLPRELGCDLLGTDADLATHGDELWEAVAQFPSGHELSMMIPENDSVRARGAERSGFVRTDERTVMSWMTPDARLRPGELPTGIRIESYAGGPHPMVARNGPAVADRLAECSLYRRDLDLSIHDGDVVAGYAMFWADPVTRVGLLEPMRIEASHQGRGLGKALIAEGLERLTAAGCTRLKVMFDPTNEPAVRLYRAAGYQPQATLWTWKRPGSG